MQRVSEIAKKALRRLVRICGYDIVKWHAVPPAAVARKRLLDSMGIDVVLDVGANAGQFAQSLRDPMRYRGVIFSFEPLSDAFAHLKQLSDQDPAWHAWNVALGESDGQLKLHVSKNRVSSSFLAIREASTSVEPDSAYETECVVNVRSLDSVFPELQGVTKDSRVMLKLDTQGFENRVIAGAKESLKCITLIQMEMSLVTLYEEEVLFLDMCNTMRNLGFELIALDPGFADVATGQLLQVDGLFVRATAGAVAGRQGGTRATGG